MAGRDLGAGLVRAGHLLAKCEFLLRNFDGEQENAELLADARRCCDAAEEGALPGDADTAATIAVLRSMAATLSLRHTVLFDVNCDFDDDDGTLLNGMGEYDEKSVSRPFAEQAVEAARAALNADPEDPLVPLYLGHALTWSGDRDGAVAAYEEAMRRDPRDECAQSSLEYLEAMPDSRPEPNETSRGHYGFALLRGFFWISNNEPDSESLLFGSVADARTHLDSNLSTYLTGDDLEDADGELVLQVHRPGQRITEYDLNARVQQEPDEVPLSIDWTGIPLHERSESPLPPGRPLRIGGDICFFGGTE